MATLSLYPLDSRCVLLTNLVWDRDARGVPCLERQKLWIRFPAPIATSGLTAVSGAPVGRVRIETALDEAGATWRLLADVGMRVSPDAVEWPEQSLTNIRIHVVEPAAPCFPLGYYFHALQLHTNAAALAALPWPDSVAPSVPLENCSPDVVERFAGHAAVHVNERLGLCHDSPQTNRLRVVSEPAAVSFTSPILSLGFDRLHARVTQLGWDTYGQDRAAANLLSTAHTQGAFPVVMRDGRRRSSESCGGRLAISGRTVRYQEIRPVPELTWNYAFTVREQGFSLELEWDCTQTFCASELAALRLPFDLYQSVTNVLAMPETTGPSGLVTLPLVINAPNHGLLRVTVHGNEGGATVFARILPLRTRAELWLDLIPGARPLPSGVFEMPAGRGRVTLDFELTRIFPDASQDLFSWWHLPPFYSFAERENVLGPLCNAWLTGLAFRPDLGRFANNSVSDSAALCAPYYADIAAYTPMLADGLDPRQFIRFAAEQYLRDTASGAAYSNWKHFPMAASSPIDCVWLYVAASGDWEWARRWREPIQHYTRAMFQLEHENRGLVASDYSGIPEEPVSIMTACWCDSIRSGHLESYVNAHVYRGLGRAADLLERLDDHSGAESARGMAARLKAAFMPTFYDPQSGQIMQWVARDGRKFGFWSHMHLGAAVALGLVPDDLARVLLRDYFARLAASGFTHYEWGLPLFLEPVPEACHNNWKGKGVEPDGSDQVGMYMNGSVHAHQSYYILQALYNVGLRREANELFMKLTPLVRRGELCGGLHSGLDWRHPSDGRAAGYEGLLAEQFHFLLAAITGYLGCELTIDGLTFRGPNTERIRNLKPNVARLSGADPASGSGRGGRHAASTTVKL